MSTIGDDSSCSQILNLDGPLSCILVPLGLDNLMRKFDLRAEVLLFGQTLNIFLNLRAICGELRPPGVLFPGELIVVGWMVALTSWDP